MIYETGEDLVPFKKELVFLEKYMELQRIRSQVIIIHETIKDMVKTLPDDRFIRIHKSFIINLEQVMYVEGNEVNTGKEKLPVDAGYKEGLIKKLSGTMPLRG